MKLWRKKPLPQPTRVFKSHVRADERSYAIDRLFFARIWRLAKPYWTRRQAWPSWLALATLLALTLSFSIGGAQMSNLSAAQTNALVAKQAHQYWSLWLLFTGAGLIRFAASIAQQYVGGRLNLHWRQWLTLHLVDRYLEHRTYYEITIDQQIDNPDQRIQEQVGPFVEAMSGIPTQLLGATADIVVQVAILAAISKSMLVATIGYTIFQTVLTLFLYRPTIRQNWNSTVAEADLRYGLLHVRDNAETIAFYNGESAEREHIESRTARAIFTRIVILKYTQFMFLVEQGSNLIWGAMPMVLIAPLYIAGQIQYGQIMQGIIAASLILQSLTVLMRYIPTLSQMAPIAVRLAEIQEKFASLQTARAASEVDRIRFMPNDFIRLTGVALETPGGEQHLISDLSFEVRPGKNLIIVGQTGSGKSALLRAMAGLWTRGSGVIEMPPREDTLFLPQRPYMVLGPLRDQLFYPKRERILGDSELQAILERVGLPELAERHGGFDAEASWGTLLSLGEQQRIGFARILIARPKYVLLDEATSAVDLAMEHQLYNLLRRSGACYASVGHRPSLVAFHEQALRIAPGAWTLLPASELAAEFNRHGTDIE